MDSTLNTTTTTAQNTDTITGLAEIRVPQPPIPDFIAKGLLNLGGIDEFGDPVLRLRFDNIKYPQGMWIVEEKWHPSVFGKREDWLEKELFQGEQMEWGEFPSKGFYAAVFVWADHEGNPLPLTSQLIDRLGFQKKMREEKNVSPEQVVADTLEQMIVMEEMQKAAVQQAQQEIAEDLKMNAETIIAKHSRASAKPISKIWKPGETEPGRIITLN